MKIFIITILSFVIITSSISCEVGEYLEKDGTCNQCHSSCSTCYSSNACATCYEQIVICQLCYLINVGCQTCITAGKCLTCSSKYFLQADNTCSKCDQLTNNCLLCRTKNQTSYCISCKNPYKLVNGLCLTDSVQSNNILTMQNSAANQPVQSTQPKGVIQIPNNNPPEIKCNSNEIMISNICYLSIAFCQQYKVNGECLKCYFDFPVQNGKCLPAILSFQQNNKDQKIEQPKVIQSELIPPNLPQCTNRQYFKVSEAKCINVPEQCKSFKKENGQCTQCIDGFYIFNGFCVQKAIIAEPQKKCNSPCLTCNPEDKNFCLQCQEGFVKVDAIQGRCFQL